MNDTKGNHNKTKTFDSSSMLDELLYEYGDFRDGSAISTRTRSNTLKWRYRDRIDSYNHEEEMMKNQKIILSSDEELFNDNKTNNNDQSCTSNHPSFDNDIENKTNNNNHSMGSHENTKKVKNDRKKWNTQKGKMVVNLLNKVKHDKELKCKAVKYIANKFQRTPGSITTKFSKSTKGNNNNNDNILMDEEHISNEYQMLYEIFEGFLPASYTEEYVKRMVTTKIKNKKNVNIITKYVMNIRQYVMDNCVDMDNIELYQEQIKVKVNNLNLENEQKKGLIQLVNDIPNKFGQDGDLHYFFIDTNIDEDIDVIIS